MRAEEEMRSALIGWQDFLQKNLGTSASDRQMAETLGVRELVWVQYKRGYSISDEDLKSITDNAIAINADVDRLNTIDPQW
jgi:hypothetical protein